MKTAVVIDACRTPVGRAHSEKGVFRDVRSDDLAVMVVRALVERSGIDPAAIEDVVLGNTQQQREQGFNVARSVGLMAGLPVEAGGATVNRLCGSAAEYRSLGLFLPTRLRSLKYSGAFFSVRRVVSLYRLLSRIPDALSSSWNATSVTCWCKCR